MAGAGAAALLLGGATYRFVQPVREAREASLEATRATLASLQGKQLTSQGHWNPAQVFAHCAQSIELSVHGYPEHKSAAFKRTIGAAAFAVFAARRAMSHGLDEPIPGAAPIADITDLDSSRQHLIRTIDSFLGSSQPLAPHFAYGELSRDEYALAHSLHILNHLEQIHIR